MRAACADTSADRPRLVPRDLDAPHCGTNQVLVKVSAAGMNRGELIQLAKNPPHTGTAQPGGIEFAGELVEIGSSVETPISLGARVMGRAPHSLAEYVAAQPEALMPIPDRLSFVQAAGFPNAFVTAHDAIVTAAAVSAGEWVLVNAASSGVGVAAIQIAKLRGASVIATSRSVAKLGVLRTLPAAPDACLVDEGNVVAEVLERTDGRGVDVIIDTVGGPALATNVSVLAIGSRLITVGRTAGPVGQLDLDRVALQRAMIIGVTFRTRTPEEGLRCSQRCADDLLDPLERGELDVLVDSQHSLDEIGAAQERMEANKHVGKIVITL